MYENLQNLLDSGDIIGFAPGMEIPSEWIELAEARLKINFPPSYRWWLENYGAGMIGDSSIYTILQQEFEDACGPDIVYQDINNKKNGTAIPDGLIIFEPESSDEIYYLDLSTTDAQGENPILLKDLELGRTRIFATSFSEFLEKQIKMRKSGRPTT